MDEAVKELTHSLSQGGEGVRKQSAYHPPPQQDLMLAFHQNGGTKQRTDMDIRFDLAVETGTIQPPETAVESWTRQHFFNSIHEKENSYAWLEHHSVGNQDHGRGNWKNCPRGRQRTTTNKAHHRSYE
tara:strand:+ start:408 stop:791 length:384 start_codon:yes stop_codon:yes gene_type:complete